MPLQVASHHTQNLVSLIINVSLLSLFCPQCAMGTARSQLDGSDFCVTCFNINPIVLRWATRSAYHIRGELWEDCLLGLFCPCCTINQVLQTTKQYGRPHPTVGPEQHNQVFSVLDNNECFANCMYSTFCLPCAIGTSLERSMGMPFILGCCCTNFCIARNLLRYHYRLIGNDCCEDCVAPYSLFAVTYMCAAFIPCVACCTYPYFVTMVMLMVNEAQKRGFTGSYLSPPPVLYTDSARQPAHVVYVQQQQQPVMVPVTVMPAAQGGVNPQFQS